MPPAFCIRHVRGCRIGSMATLEEDERQRKWSSERSRSISSTPDVIEHAVAYFGSRVLYLSRPAPGHSDNSPLSRAACEKAAQAAVRGDASKYESTAQDMGYRIGSQIYDAYLAGKVAPSGLRRLFLAHLDEPGLARKVCTAVIAKLRSVSNSKSRAAHA